MADVDVAIIGGGPAGSAIAAYLAKEGADCVVFERELFPREHVGESLVPSSTRVFRELGVLEKMEQEKFPHKFGAVWTAHGSDRSYEHDWDGLAPSDFADIEFAEREQEGVDQKYTYHVDRGRFDLMMLQHAHELGAAVYEGVRVNGIDPEIDDGALVNFSLGNRDMSLKAKIVVDASGRNTIVGNQMGWKRKDPVFDQFALHTWFDGYDRTVVAGESDKTDFIYVHFLPISNSWVWQIPITDSITSVGVVTQRKNFKMKRASREAFFWDAVRSREEFGAALDASTQMRPLKAEGDYSYGMSRIVDDNVVLVGDAARFVDPIFSTGVSIALNSARFAYPDILSALEKGDYSASSFSGYETTIRRGTKIWHEFISLYYRLNVLFTAFIRDDRYRHDVLKLLQGDVYDEEAPPVLTEMREIVTKVENNPRHPWHQALGTLTANAFAAAG